MCTDLSKHRVPSMQAGKIFLPSSARHHARGLEMQRHVKKKYMGILIQQAYVPTDTYIGVTTFSEQSNYTFHHSPVSPHYALHRT